MNEIESLYYSYLSLGQYDDIASSMLLSSLIMIAAVIVFYITLIDGDLENKNAKAYFKVAKVLCIVGISLFILSALASLYFYSAKKFTRVEIEKICINYTHPLCERKP